MFWRRLRRAAISGTCGRIRAVQNECITYKLKHTPTDCVYSPRRFGPNTRRKELPRRDQPTGSTGHNHTLTTGVTQPSFTPASYLTTRLPNGILSGLSYARSITHCNNVRRLNTVYINTLYSCVIVQVGQSLPLGQRSPPGQTCRRMAEMRS